MKSLNAAIGTILMLFGVGALFYAIVIISGSCAYTNQAAALAGIPTCSQAVTLFWTAIVLTVSFLGIGAVVLLTGREKLLPPEA
ncbi:MAG: hypothetical protein M1368_12715 [Thaumarchaeota archaeon]|nr:hypothetical protein [Nitrososphaerota archaeon]